MLNVTFDGFAWLNSTGAKGNSNVYYRAFFFPNGTASSPATWNDVRLIENTGYYNCNAGDGTFLSQTGTALPNAKVIIVFWKPNRFDLSSNRNTLCGPAEPYLVEWSAMEITLDGSDTYTNDVEVKGNSLALGTCPVLVWDLPLLGYVNTVYNAVNTSYDVHNWTFHGTEMYHWRTRYGENLQLINTVIQTDYDWGDGNQDLNLPSVGADPADGSHSWNTAGNYTVEIKVRDECQCEQIDTKSIRIYWHSPTCGLKCNEAVGNTIAIPDTVVTFEFDGTDVDGTILGIRWKINDSGAYGNTDTTYSGSAGDTVPHSSGLGTDWCGDAASPGAFTNPGNHLVEAWVYWNDGFTDQILYCSETFTQEMYTGPTVDFNQVPAQATVSSGVKFVNASTSTSRVGLGLPDCYEYTWTWDDDGNVETEVDKPYAYELQKVPTTANCTVKLCADYSDGWDTHTTCVQKDVAFKTIITVTPVECFYNLHIIGTSSDGSLTGYNWEVYQTTTSGAPGPGWELLWTSPTGLDQQDKKICFTFQNYYKIIGYAHGTGTTTWDDEILYIDVVCPSDDLAHIWNGTGILDTGSDWNHSGWGFEASYAKHWGTNGLDADGMTSGTTIYFDTVDITDTTRYDLFAMWMKINEWQQYKDLKIGMYLNGVLQGKAVNVNDYINYTGRLTDLTDWQRILIPLEDFNMPGLDPRNVNEVRFIAQGTIGVYMDDLMFGIGAVIEYYIPAPDPKMYAEEQGQLFVDAKVVRPSLRSTISDPKPHMEVTDTSIRPSMKATDDRPSVRASYPLPRNL
jgi:hypothetical protein